ncbi:MAG: 2'-5' RNA ligase family protein [Herpetosiphonaceae bacterium]|nr:2'-5' RNA ligase family protein [Herpetosiphonaceae bacterium]
MRPDLTALIVPLHQLTPLLQPFLLQHVQSPAATVPPHITLHMPFLPATAITPRVLSDLAQLCAATPAFDSKLGNLSRFPQAGVLYLEPDPDTALLALSTEIQRRYPEAPADFPEPIMHLSLSYAYAAADLDRIERLFKQAYQQDLPLNAAATSVSLYVKRNNVWHEHTVFPLARPGSR